MSGNAQKDLEAWVPRLLRVWRSKRKSTGPQDSLSPNELKEVAAGVKTLSHGLTRERELAGAQYMDDPRLLGAYLLFYWPVSYAQCRQVLGEINGRPKSALDLGSGPGPMAFAALDAGAASATCADRSRPALELALKLAAEADTALSTREWNPDQPVPPGPHELITMGHLLNELYGGSVEKRAALLERSTAQLKKGGHLAVIDPALRETSRALLQVRDAVVAKGYAVRAPCLYRGECPALIKPSDWCHAERDWAMPKLTEAIARAAGLHKESLKMSYLVLAPQGEAWAEAPAGRVFRIVSEPLEGKGRQRFMGCGPEGRIGLAIQEKHRTAGNESFFSLKRGDVVRVDHAEPKGDGIAMTDQSTVEVVAKAGWALKP